MNEQYEFGRFIRNNYSGFLSQPFDMLKVLFRSTDYTRTLMSAYSMAAGIYPPSQNQIFNPAFPNWQPIPVLTNDRNIEPVY